MCVFLLRRGALATHHSPTGLGSSASASTVEKVLLSLYDDGMSKTHTIYTYSCYEADCVDVCGCVVGVRSLDDGRNES